MNVRSRSREEIVEDRLILHQNGTRSINEARQIPGS